MLAPPATDSPSWHSMPAQQVAERLGTGEGGLSTEEARRRLASHGPNLLPKAKRRSALLRFLAQFNNSLIYFLLIGAAAAFLLDHILDAVVIVAVVIINALIGFIQEGRAERALESIQGMIAPQAHVVRDGRRQTIPVSELVPGDLVLLEAGDRVPADLRLLHARRLLIDEAVLTGESLAAEKGEKPVAEDAPLGDRRSMAFSGTLVAAGQASGIVTATGAQTQIGRISTLIQEVQSLSTPLLRKIEDFARRFTGFVLVSGALLFAFAILVRGYDWIDALIAVVALAVGIVPEGLPAVITITLAIGVRRMAQRNAVIRKLPAVETLGATTTICTDKTGTLTRNEMTARRIVTRSALLRVEGAGYAPEGVVVGEDGTEADPEAVLPLIQCAVLCNDASLVEADGQWRVEGDPMEGALLTLAAKAGLDHEAVRNAMPRLDLIPFDAAHRFMATLHRAPDGGSAAFIKGAPEALFERTEGEDLSFWNNAILEAASEGERMLAFGTKRMGADSSTLDFDQLSGGVELLGLIGFIDPPRPEARQAIAECRSAGISVRMITGDHAATARAIALQLGLAEAPEVLTGSDLDRLDEEALREKVRSVHVFARTSPEHKLRIVRALQAEGHIVAMTGDGVNDAPSLKQADVGVAMGIKGTEASKEAAEMVLLDDNFASIVSAVREGRTVYDNIRKVITWEIPTNGGETLAVVLAILVGFALPMSAIQILWSNLVMAGTLGIVLAFEPAEPGVMQRPPRRPDAPLLSPFLVWRVFLVSVLYSTAALAVFFFTLSQGRALETARTMVVNAFIVCEIFYLFNVRFLHTQSLTWRGALGTPAVLIAIAVLVLLQLVFTYAPFMNAVFESRPLSFADGALLVGIGFGLMVLLEGEKLLMRRLGWFEELRS